MNTLEEAVFSSGVSPNERQMIDGRLRELVPALDQLRAQSQALASEAQRVTNPEQYKILSEIVDYNAKLLPVNDQSLHNVIEQERALQRSLVDLQNKTPKVNGTVASGPADELDRKMDHAQLTYIQKLEEIDFPAVANIKKVDRTLLSSFNKVWVWVLEVFFGVPSSKYFWDDFAKKALSRSGDSGAELRRKMIVFDPRRLSAMQAKELDTICSSDLPFLADKLPPNEEMRKFFDILALLNGLYKIAMQKSSQKTSGMAASDMRFVEEEKNAIVASLRLNAVKYDLMTDVQNLYLLIESEFK